MDRSVIWLVFSLLVAGCSGDDSSASSSTVPDAGGDASDAGSDASGGSAGAGGTSGAGGSGATAFDGPAKLSETGLYADIATRELAAGVIAFEPRYATWVDGLTSNRYVLLPTGTQIDTSNMDHWSYPVGTKAWKDFAKDGKLIETRYLEKRAEGTDGWLQVAYAWDAAATEALPAPDGVPNALGTNHDVPSQSDCTQCHNGEPSVILGASAIQLSREAGNGPLTDWVAKGMLSNPPAGEFPIPGDGVVEDALGYLHVNCAHCHNNTHFLAPTRSIRYRLFVGATTPEETPTYQTNFMAKMDHVVLGAAYSIVPGNPDQSQSWVRISYRDVDSMPPYDTKVVDAAGVETIKQWILGLK